MSTPPGDEARSDASSAAPSPEGPTAWAAPASHKDHGGADATTTPRPPQSWFTPLQSPPPPVPEPQARTSTTLADLLGLGLLAAAALLLISVFLPWNTWSLPDFGRDPFSIVRAPRPHTTYGVDGNDGLVVVLAGMATLGLAVAARATTRRLAPYAALPGVLGLIAILHEGITLDAGELSKSLAWGYWVSLPAAVAVVGFALALLTRARPQS